MILYAIRHKVTWHYLPQRDGAHTHANLQDCTTGRCLPRLHTTKKGANIALSLWLRGALMWSYNEYGHRETLDWHPVPGRNQELMEVVEMRLEVANGNNSDAGDDRSGVADWRNNDSQDSDQDGEKDKLGALAVGTAYC